MAGSSDTIVDLSQAMVTAPTTAADWLVIAPVALCLTFSALSLMFRKDVSRQAPLAIVGFALLLIVAILLLRHVWMNGTMVMTMGRWLPPFGISFTVDMLGAMFVLTTAVIALLASIHALADLDSTQLRYGFFPFLFLMIGGVCGAFLTGDIFNLYVWFEVLLISSFGLLVLGSEREQIDGTTKYAYLNLVATTLFLVATGYLYGIFGTLNMADIARKAPLLRETAPLMTLAVLYFFAFGMKAAAFPVNFWLPASYHTPRIVVSALFAGLLTKVGVYALLRSLVVLLPAERAILAELIAWVAASTMLLGALGALAQNDIRRLLGFVVVSGIGVMMAGLALGSPLGLSGAMVYAVHSMLVMTALYIAAGLAGSITGGFRLDASGGVYKASPFVAFAILALGLSVSGLPPFSGLWPKAMLVKASLDVGAWWLAGAILLTGLLTSIATVRVFLLACWRDRETVEGATSGGLLRAAPLAALLAMTLAIGVYPQPLLEAANTAAAAILDNAGWAAKVFPEAVQP